MFSDLEELILNYYDQKERRSTNRLKTALNHLTGGVWSVASD